MRTNYFVFCDAAVRTADGKACLIGIFDRIKVKKDVNESEITVHPSMSVAFDFWELKNSRGKVRVTLTHVESDKQVFSQEVETRTQGENEGRLSGIMGMKLIPIIGLGTYRASVELDGELIGTADLTVERA